MKKILAVFTGGTIGSTVLNHTIDVDEKLKYLLVEKFHAASKLQVQFETIQPFNILSENCIPSDWAQLIQTINSKNLAEYDGVVIVHGTDTLPYTSAMMGYVFGGINIPMVLTASNYAIGHPQSNGVRNFISSVEFICKSKIPGVFAVFEDKKGIQKVYLATRMIEADPFNDQFSGFGGIDLGYLEAGLLFEYKSDLNPTKEELMTTTNAMTFNNIDFNNNILAIKPYPGLDYEYFDFKKKKPRAIIHKLYHSATACIRQGSVSLPQFIKYCIKEGIDFYLTSFKDVNQDLYASSRELLENHVIPLQNISFEATVAKLWLAYNMENETPKAFMQKKIYYEYLTATKNG